MVQADAIPWRAVVRGHAAMLAAIAAVALCVWGVHRGLGIVVAYNPAPFQIVGVALAILIAFRNNAAYDRWWEGRKLWGGIVNASRTLARQATTLVDGEPDEVRRLVLRQIGWCHALAASLRAEDAVAAASPWLEVADRDALATQRNVPAALMQAQGAALARLRRAGAVSDERTRALDATLTELVALQGGCERISATPLPLAYRVFTRTFVRAYCLALPVGLVESLGPLTVVVVLAVGFVFLTVETVGRMLESPFVSGVYGLPLRAISRNIEINLRQQLGEVDVPPPLAAERHGTFLILS